MYSIELVIYMWGAMMMFGASFSFEKDFLYENVEFWVFFIAGILCCYFFVPGLHVVVYEEVRPVFWIASGSLPFAGGWIWGRILR